MVSWVIVKLPHQTSPKGDHIPHEQKYNTRHGLSAIPNEVHREIRRQPRQPEVQQEPVVHLFLEAALGRKCGVPGLPVQTASQPPQPAHGGRAKAHPRYAPPQSVAGWGGCEAVWTGRPETPHYRPSAASRSRCTTGFCCISGWRG